MDELLTRYLSLLMEWNGRMNLTAVRDAEGIRERHFADSLKLFDAAQLYGKSVVDVGSGAGFPGLPLRIRDETIRLTLLEATGKKADFLRTVCRELDLEDVCVCNRRAEEAAHEAAFRARFDVAVARGVAALPLLAELLLPFVRLGGVMLAMKENGDELPSARRAMAVLGGEEASVYEYSLNPSKKHSVIVVKKTRPTPDLYPRPWRVMQRAPLI